MNSMTTISKKEYSSIEIYSFWRRYKKLRTILRSLKQGTTITSACNAAGIDPSTLWFWRRDNARLTDIIYEIIDSRIQIAEDSLFKNVLAGSVNAQKEFLHNRAPNRWKADAAINQIININKDKKEEETDAFKVVPRIIFTSRIKNE